jgi:hypothetical protein
MIEGRFSARRSYFSIISKISGQIAAAPMCLTKNNSFSFILTYFHHFQAKKPWTLSLGVNVVSGTIWSKIVRKRATSTITPPQVRVGSTSKGCRPQGHGSFTCVQPLPVRRVMVRLTYVPHICVQIFKRERARCLFTGRVLAFQRAYYTRTEIPRALRASNSKRLSMTATAIEEDIDARRNQIKHELEGFAFT